MRECVYLKQKQDWLAQKECNLFGANQTHRDNKSNPENNKMPCWYYDKKRLRETPSIMEGLPIETERRYRKEGARFILDCGTKMGLGINTIATGVVYFHRFYMMHSFKSFPRYVTACCCLFLAGKVEETPKKCRDIIRTARSLLSDDHYYSFGDDPKEEVMTLERIILQTIKFDLQVQHPHTYLLKYAKCFKGDQQKLQKMVQMAWNFVNDSMSTVVCLQWEPEIIAVALIHLASKLSKFTVVDWAGKQPNHSRWWDMFVGDVTMDILEDICHQVLDLYQSNQKEPEQKSPPQKPPSRADSPTQTPRSLPVNSNTSSPNNKQTKSTPTTNASTNSTATENNNVHPIKALTTTTPTPVAVPPVVETTTANPQPINITAGPPAAPYHHHMFHAPPPLNPHHMHGALYGANSGNSVAAPAANTLAPPPPHPPVAPHGFPTSSGTSGGPLPPPPPVGIPAYTGAPPPNAWGPIPPHYGNMPPPIPPHAGPPPAAHGNASGPNNSSGNYYTSTSSSYGRQQRY